MKGELTLKQSKTHFAKDKQANNQTNQEKKKKKPTVNITSTETV